MPTKAITTILCALVTAACSAPEADGPVMLRGRIDPAMANRVDVAIAAGRREFVIDSPGGYVLSAVRIAKSIAQAKASVTARGECRSACAPVLMAAMERRVEPGTVVSLHDSARLPGYALMLEGFGVPRDIIAKHAGDINDRPLSQAELARMGLMGKLYPATGGRWHP